MLSSRAPVRCGRLLRTISPLVASLLAVEFLDELAFGTREASWPSIREELGLSYAEIGTLIAVPTLVASLVEPVLGIVADTRHRRAVISCGGLAFAAAAGLVAASDGFASLMVAMLLFSPASGAFVSLSQADLMDSDPAARDRNMARWAAAGSAGAALGPLLLAAAYSAGLGWRALYACYAVVTVAALVGARRAGVGAAHADEPALDVRESFAGTAAALRRRDVVRWLVLLQCGDLMLDVLHAFLALYLVDAAGASTAGAGLAVALWVGVGLAGDVALIALLSRVDGIAYLRASAAATLALYPAFLLVPSFGAKLAILSAIGVLNAGWYSILQARLYAALPGRSGAVLALTNVAGLVGGLAPLGVGAVAGVAGVGSAMWLLLLGPVALLVGLRSVTRGT